MQVTGGGGGSEIERGNEGGDAMEVGRGGG